MDLSSRAKGCLVGAAIGDALGMPTEDIPKKLRDHLYGGPISTYVKPHQNHPCAHLKPGQYTDDTQQIIILAQSLVGCSGFDVDDFAKRFAQWGRYCRSIPNYNRYAGGSSIGAAMELLRGVPPSKSGSETSRTCGAAMRVAPIGLFYQRAPLEQVLAAAQTQARVSHGHVEAVDSAVFLAGVVYGLANGEMPLEGAKRMLPQVSGELFENLSYVLEQVGNSSLAVAERIGKSQYAKEAVPMAVHCFLRSPDDFETTVLTAANLVQGDTDSIACMAGAMSGAFVGLGGIPRRFIEPLENKDLLLELAEKLTAKR